MRNPKRKIGAGLVAAAWAIFAMISPNAASADVQGLLGYYMDGADSTWPSAATVLAGIKRNNNCVGEVTKNLANTHAKELQDARKRCRADLAEIKADQQFWGTTAAALDAGAQAAGQVEGATDVTGQLLDRVQEIAGAGEDFSKVQEDKAGARKDTKKQDTWGDRRKKCGKWKKGADKLLKRINLAHSTASWTKEICECAKNQCSEWQEDLEDDIDDTNKACDELDRQFHAWNEIWDIWNQQQKGAPCNE